MKTSSSFLLVIALSFTTCLHAQDVRLTLFEGHHNNIKSVEFSSDRKWVLTVPEGGAIKIWEVSTGRLLHSVKPSYNILVGAFFNAKSDGVIIISSNSIGTDHEGGAFVEEFNLATGKRIHEVKFEGLACPFSWDCVSGYSIDPARGFVQVNSVAQSFMVNLSKWIVTYDRGRIIDTRTIVLSEHSPTTHKTKVTLQKAGSATVLAQYFIPEDDQKTSSVRIASNELFVQPGKGRDWHSFDLSTGKPKGIFQFDKEIADIKIFDDKRLFVFTDNSWRITDASNRTINESNTGKLPTDVIFSEDFFVETFKASSEVAIRILSASGETKTQYKIPGTGRVVMEGNKVVQFGNDGGAKFFDVMTGKTTLTLHGHSNPVSSVDLGQNADLLLTTSPRRKGEMIDLNTGNIVSRFEHTGKITNGFISPDGKRVFTLSEDKKIKIWDTATGELVYINNSGHTKTFWPMAFSPEGHTLATKCDSGIGIELWDVATGELKDVLERKDGLSYPQSIYYSADGSRIIAAEEQSIKLWDATTNKVITKIQARDKVRGASLSPNNKFIATSVYGSATVWNAETSKILFSDHTGDAIITDFSSDGKFLVVGTVHAGIRLIDVATWKYVRTIPVPSGVKTIYQLKDGLMLTTSIANYTQLVSLSDGKVLREWAGFVGSMSAAKGRIALINDNSGITIVDLKSQAELLTYYAVGESDWVVTHPSGLFDASPGASPKLYFVQGTDFIRFDQIKHRYYEPGLWKKVMAGEKLRDVVGFKSIALPPDIHLSEVDEKGYINIELTNKGGGIGEVSILLHGKEIVKDARPKDSNPDAPSLTIRYYVSNHKGLRKDLNMLAARAWNKDHWVESRSEVITYVKGEKENYTPAVHILACGVSDYAGGSDIDLKFAAKDAEDVSMACNIGAQRLFGTDKKFLYTLTTSQPPDRWPTRANILKAFREIQAKAHPADVVVVYLSGHGINIGGAEGDWYYLTQEAFATSLASFSDPSIREKSTISSNELVELFNEIPAEKQVLVIDACASGKVVDNLIARKDIPSGTLRAIDRMKDRTGMHIITGCTADAVSYEASRYGQGVLTYSLLEGIRGAALRDYEFVDVSQLFRYAQDRVPQLASGIGGIQSPMVFSPDAGQSFDIGQLNDGDRKSVPIAKIRPVYIQSNFQDDDEMADVLELGKKVDAMLNETGSKGIDAPLIFIPVREYPEGCQLIGRYRSEGGKINLRLRKKCDGKDATVNVSGSDVNQLTAEISKILSN